MRPELTPEVEGMVWDAANRRRCTKTAFVNDAVRRLALREAADSHLPPLENADLLAAGAELHAYACLDAEELSEATVAVCAGLVRLAKAERGMEVEP